MGQQIDGATPASYARWVSSSKRSYQTLFLAAGIVLVVISLAGICFPGSHPVPPETQRLMNRFDRMHNIALVIQEYARDHDNALPAKLSDLVPDYVPDLAYLVFCPWRPDAPEQANFAAHRELVDQLTPYSFLRLADDRLVVFERTEMSKEGKMLYCLVGNDGERVGNAGTSQVAPAEFARRLEQGFPDFTTVR